MQIHRQPFENYTSVHAIYLNGKRLYPDDFKLRYPNASEYSLRILIRNIVLDQHMAELFLIADVKAVIIEIYGIGVD